MLGFDIDDLSPDDVDGFQKTGGMVPAGKHLVELVGAKDHAAISGSTADELTFTILSGPAAGQEITERVWHSDKPAGKRRQALFANKLGLIRREGSKFVPVEGKDSYADCIGAQVVLDVEHEKYTTKDGKEGVAVRVKFTGIYATTDKEAVGVKKAGGKVTTGKGKGKGSDAADL